MPVDSVTTTATTSSSGASTTSLQKLGEDYTSFLKLLTAQIQYQDPLEPMDSTAFVSQLAQLSQVEQAVSTNSNLEQVNAYLAATTAMSDIQLIGHDVTLATDTVELIDGKASFEYQVDENAGLVTAKIIAADGSTVVRELTGLPGLAGGEIHTVEWDGTDSAGLPVPDANFTVELEAKTTDGEAVSATVYNTSRVEQLSFETGTPTLFLRNGTTTTSGNIITIR